MVEYSVNTPYPVGPVHLYVLEHREGLILFDTGPPTEENFEFLERCIPLDELKYVFVTHSHADHCGGLGFLAERTKARIVVPGKDIRKHRVFADLIPRFRALFCSLGFPDNIVNSIVEAIVSFEKQVVMPDSVLPSEYVHADGVEILSCPGHSITDYVYMLNGFAVAGDFLLSGIFQTPLLEIDPDTLEVFDNYAAYCESITRLERIEGMRVLPGHGSSGSPLDVVAFYVGKTLKRSEALLRCNGFCSVFEAVETFMDPVSEPFKAYLKASEVVFFRRMLSAPERLKEALRRIGLFDRFRSNFFRIEGVQAPLLRR